MLIMVYSVTEAETIEGLFDIVDLWIFISAADFAARDVLLELCFAEDHSVLALPSLRTRQQDIGSMASMFQQRGYKSKHKCRSLATNVCAQELTELNSLHRYRKKITFKSQDVVGRMKRFQQSLWIQGMEHVNMAVTCFRDLKANSWLAFLCEI